MAKIHKIYTSRNKFYGWLKNVGKNVLNQVYRVSTYDACPVALNGFKAFNLKPKKIKKNSNAALNAQIQHPNK